MKKELFKKGDRVFVRSWGWGIITHTKRKKSAILFEEEPYNKAVYIPNEVISFTEYFVENFSQERPINYNDYIGKWGKFFDDNEGEIVISKLKGLSDDIYFPYLTQQEVRYAHFEPLTDEQIQILNLKFKIKKVNYESIKRHFRNL